jgi:hypothetical protein
MGTHTCASPLVCQIWCLRDRGYFIILFLGRVLLLAKEWMPTVLLTKQAAVYLAAVLEYLATEILHPSGKSATDNGSAVIVPRFILLAVKSQMGLSSLFRSITFRDSAVRSPHVHRIFTMPLAPEEENNDNANPCGDLQEPRSYGQMFIQNFDRCVSCNGDEPYLSADAFSGYLYTMVEGDLVFSSPGNLSSILTRRQRHVAAIGSLFGRDRDLLAAEFPISSSRADIMKLSPSKLRSTMLRGIKVEAWVELCCIDRSAVQYLLQNHAPSRSFTHEAVNVVVLSQQRYLRKVLQAAVFSSPTMRRGMIQAADVTNARSMIEVIHAAKVGDLPTLERIIVHRQLDVNIICRSDTALTAACEAGQLASIRWLVAHGANVDLNIKAGTSPTVLTAILIVAMERQPNIDVIRLLLDLGANIDSAGGDIVGSSLLIYLCRTGDTYIEFIQELIARGVNIHHMAGHRNALHTACEEQQVATAEALIFGGIDVTTKVFNSTAVDKIRDAEAKERLERAIQQMEEPGLK